MNVLRRRSSSSTRKPSQARIFKKFIEFLETEDWKLPTVNFLEKNSILFNHDQATHDLCVQAHKQYTDLVDTLIESYCQDTNISTKDLVDALKFTDKNAKLSDKEKRLLETVVAAQDFNVFVPLMTRINIELQLQAVKMLEHICGVRPVSLKLTEDEVAMWQSLFDEDETERYIIISVMKQSKEEYDQDEELKKALQDAFQASIDDVRNLEQQRDEEINSLNKALEGTTKKLTELKIDGEDQPNSSGASAQKPPKSPTETEAKPKKASSRQSKPPLKPLEKPVNMRKLSEEKTPPADGQRLKFDLRTMLNKKTGDSDPEKLQQRAEYLKQQRDKLLAAKQQQREKQLIDAARKSAAERPRTSQAARGALQGSLTHTAANADMLEARKAIANKIREQVMGGGSQPPPP